MTDGILNGLKVLVAQSRLISTIVPEVEAQLTTDKRAPQAWRAVPLSQFRNLPPQVQSIWVFVLRAGAVFGAERHPNSHQRTLPIRGHAVFETLGPAGWTSIEVGTESNGISIPPGTWHRIRVGQDGLSSISFHTVRAAELLEETPLSDDFSRTRSRLYHT